MDPKSKKVRWTAQSGYQMASKTTVLQKWHPLWAILGSPPGPKNQQQIDPWPKKGCKEAYFYRFFERKAIFSLLGSTFHRFWVKKQRKHQCIFSKLRMIFSTWRSLKSMHRRSVFSTFSFFHFCKIYKNMTPQTQQNWYHQKTPKNDALGVSRWSQNGSELIGKLLKILKIVPEICFLRSWFFDVFLRGQKTFLDGWTLGMAPFRTSHKGVGRGCGEG